MFESGVGGSPFTERNSHPHTTRRFNRRTKEEQWRCILSQVHEYRESFMQCRMKLRVVPQPAAGEMPVPCVLIESVVFEAELRCGSNHKR